MNISSIGFIGAGNMATAIISGLIRNKFNNSHIFVSSPEEDHLEKLKNNFSVNAIPVVVLVAAALPVVP